MWNLEIRHGDGGDIVFGGPGSVERDSGYAAAIGFELPDVEVSVSDERIVAGVIHLTRDDLVQIHEWTREALTSVSGRLSQ